MHAPVSYASVDESVFISCVIAFLPNITKEVMHGIKPLALLRLTCRLAFDKEFRSAIPNPSIFALALPHPAQRTLLGSCYVPSA